MMSISSHVIGKIYLCTQFLLSKLTFFLYFAYYIYRIFLFVLDPSINPIWERIFENVDFEFRSTNFSIPIFLSIGILAIGDLTFQKICGFVFFDINAYCFFKQQYGNVLYSCQRKKIMYSDKSYKITQNFECNEASIINHNRQSGMLKLYTINLLLYLFLVHECHNNVYCYYYDYQSRQVLVIVVENLIKFV